MLRTERLLLRPFTPDDVDDLAALHAEPTFWWYPLRRSWTRTETEAYLERILERYACGTTAVWAVVVAGTGRLAGSAGLAIPDFLPEVLPAVEVGWRFGREHWGRGYATEAGARWVRYGFEEMGLDEIVSIYEPENERSGAVMERLGFTFERETVHPVQGVRLHVTSLTRRQWEARSGPG